MTLHIRFSALNKVRGYCFPLSEDCQWDFSPLIAFFEAQNSLLRLFKHFCRLVGLPEEHSGVKRLTAAMPLSHVTAQQQIRAEQSMQCKM